MKHAFKFADLFAGVGGFHAALSGLGGELAYGVEIDERAAAVYEANWGHNILGDITLDANDETMTVPNHDVLAAGFPCQPFSKSGPQKGMEETRGTLYWNILKVIQAHHPKVVVLENVRNLIGPRHRHEWATILSTLRAEGYYVASRPSVISPHQLPARLGGRPQVRERVFITATWVPPELRGDDRLHFDPDPILPPGHLVENWDPKSWDISEFLDDDSAIESCSLSGDEVHWINSWDAFVRLVRENSNGQSFPSFPIWADTWREFRSGNNEIDWYSSDAIVPTISIEDLPKIDPGLPDWKQTYLRKNHDFFLKHHGVIIPWSRRVQLFTTRFPQSRRKLEWQAQEQESLWDTVIQLRPSGIRAKTPNYLPALVAITQTSIFGPRRRRLSPTEVSILQGLPVTFDFGNQKASSTYRQMGNGVNVGAVWFAMKAHVERDSWILEQTEQGKAILEAVRNAPASPDAYLVHHLPKLHSKMSNSPNTTATV